MNDFFKEKKIKNYIFKLSINSNFLLFDKLKIKESGALE